MRVIAAVVALCGVFAWEAQDSAVSQRPAPQAPRQPSTLVLSGVVTAVDKGTYQEHAFEVPAGVSRLDVEFTHSHTTDGTQLEVGLFDPSGFRGASRFSKRRFHIADAHATPSYVPGRLPAGRWRVSLGIPAIGAATTATWQVTIRMTPTENATAGLAATLAPGPAWFAGDFHAHTLHSDAFECHEPGRVRATRGCQPWEVVEAARAERLDFLAITDHNTTSHHADLATLQEGLTGLLLLRGQELTTFRGHANVYGTSAAIDFRVGFKGRGIADVLRDVSAAGGLLSINHPGRETGDRCTGCGWDAPGTPWADVAVMEVVNGPTIEGPTAGLPFWHSRLNEGHRITAIGGSDDHAARSDRGRVGRPTTVVWASDLSESGLLDGVRAGRVYIRTRGVDGPVVDLSAEWGGQRAAMGGVLAVRTGAVVALRSDTSRAAGQTAELVKNGELAASVPIASSPSSITHSLAMQPGDWVHLRLRDAAGVTAVSNPIYVR